MVGESAKRGTRFLWVFTEHIVSEIRYNFGEAWNSIRDQTDTINQMNFIISDTLKKKKLLRISQNWNLLQMLIEGIFLSCIFSFMSTSDERKQQKSSSSTLFFSCIVLWYITFIGILFLWISFRYIRTLEWREMFHQERMLCIGHVWVLDEMEFIWHEMSYSVAMDSSFTEWNFVIWCVTNNERICDFECRQAFWWWLIKASLHLN